MDKMSRVEVSGEDTGGVERREGGKRKSSNKSDTVMIRARVNRETWMKFLAVITHDHQIRDWIGIVIERFVEEEERKRRERSL